MTVGLAAIDNCVGTGACPLNCGTASCSTNQAFCAWPTFLECSGGPNCAAQAIDGAAGCGSCVQFVGPSGCASGTVGCATIWECGPAAGQSSTGYYCSDGSSQPIIACVTSSAFTTLCGGCNPFTYGLVLVTGTPF